MHARRSPRGFPDTDTPGRIVAHRGASRVAPENTLSAFRAAAAQFAGEGTGEGTGRGAGWIEFDVSLLGDGTPVVHHDATLDRCTDRSGPLSGLGAADLAGIDAGGWFDPAFAGEPLATLEQALALLGELGLSANLEMKPHGAAPGPIAGAVADALGRRPWTRDRVLVSSFDFAALAALRRLLPEQPLAVLYEAPAADWPGTLAELHAGSLHVAHQHLDDHLLARTRAEGVHLRVYTINAPARVALFRATGLGGVITDHPPLFLEDPGWVAWARDQAM